MYIAFDPGGRHTGWARFKKDGEFISKGVLTGREELMQFLDTIHQVVTGPGNNRISGVIIEDFEMYPHMEKKLIWSKFEVCRTIGIIEGWCWINQSFIGGVHFQKPAIKNIAYMWAKLPNQHKHDEDAYVHGIHWLHKNGVRSVVNL